MGTWGLSHPPHSDLCLPGLCPGVLTLAIPLWASQLSAHTASPGPSATEKHQQGLCSGGAIPSIPAGCKLRQDSPSPSCALLLLPCSQGWTRDPPIRPSPLTLNTWSSSRTTSSGSAESPAWRAMTLSTEPESEMGEKGSGGEEGAARAPAHSPVRPPYPAHPPVPKKMTS